jgi:hypothetical protein
MDVKEIVNETASKFTFNKYFVVGAIAGATTVGLVFGAKKLKNVIDAKRAENDEEGEL